MFPSASQLLLARDRVRFSALLTVAMVNAALGVIINWLGLWQLGNIKHWSLGEVVLQLGWVIPNYFSCSLVAMPCSESGKLDMAAFFERQRRVISSATLALSVMGGLQDYLDRNNIEGWKANEWIGAELDGIIARRFCAAGGLGEAALASVSGRRRHVRSKHLVFCFLHARFLTA